MIDPLLYLAAANLFLCLVMVIQIWRGDRHLHYLRDVPPLEGPLPRVSIIVAARNEERHLEAALQSLLRMDYDNCELMVVNDRSEDGTGEILDRMRGEYPRLNVVHVTDLPSGWLGKNHALYYGALQAGGEYLLFTDADVVMDPSVLRRAVAYARQHEIDHLPMMFRVDMPHWILESFALTFIIYFWSFVRPWKVRDPRSAAHVGAGGFNLIRADVYREIGTYKAIALRPDDDIKLGKLVKKHGFRQELLLAIEFLRVPGYQSVREAINGLEKNVFSGVDYSILLTLFSSMLVLVLHVFPFVAVWITAGMTRWLYVAVVGVLLFLGFHVAGIHRIRRSCCLAFPLAASLFVYIQWRTMLWNLALGGIRWRGTFYPLAELKANRV